MCTNNVAEAPNETELLNKLLAREDEEPPKIIPRTLHVQLKGVVDEN